MGPARIYPWRRMHRSRAPSIAPGTFFVAQSWAGCITNMSGFNLRQAQGMKFSKSGSGRRKGAWVDRWLVGLTAVQFDKVDQHQPVRRLAVGFGLGKQGALVGQRHPRS